MLGCKHGVRAMLERGAGSIINSSSGSAAAGDLLLSAYGASKGAVNSFTRYVAAQYGKQGIRCNAIAPGLIKSEGVISGMGPERIAEIEEHCLAPRTGDPEDIAEMVVFLASDAASFVTAQIIAVDGGIGAHVPTYADKNRAHRGNAH
jgi:NAD(P)-dependent dehydrogenase (short-subunit alcohol dehydrogenase family)